MPSITIEWKPNLSKIVGAFSSVDLSKAIDEGVELVARGIERGAKQLTPVDTGLLRSSIHVRGLGSGVREILTNQVYSRWIHYGVRNDPRFGRVRIKGRGKAGTPAGGVPFMRLGAELTMERFGERDFNFKIDKALKSKLTGL